MNQQPVIYIIEIGEGTHSAIGGRARDPVVDAIWYAFCLPMSMRCWLLGICLLAATGCGDTSPGAPTVPLDERFTLAPGASALVGDSGIRVLFVQVSSDSRCPADAVCVVAGDATVQVRVGEGDATMPYELHTDDPNRAAVVHEGFRLTLVELQPYPFSSRPTLPAEYRATFILTRA